MEKFINKVAVVTGSSSGTGAAISKELVKHGVIVVGLARRIEKLKEIENELAADENCTGKFYPLKCDITIEDDIKSSFKWILSELGPLSILVNNAGVSDYSLLSRSSADVISQVFDTNVRGSILCAKEAIKIMSDNSVDGHIINMCSILGHYMWSSNPNMVQVYSSSKHALKMISEALRRELVYKKKDIKITNMSPGRVKTEMTMRLPPCDSPKLELEPKDVADACVYVLSTPFNVVISEITILPLHQEL